MADPADAISDVHCLCLRIRAEAGKAFLYEGPLPEPGWRSSATVTLYNFLVERAQELPPAIVIACRRLARFLETYNSIDDHYDQERFYAGDTEQIIIFEEIDRCLREIEKEYEDVKQSASEQELGYVFPEEILPPDVTDIVNLTYEEALRDYSNSCYTSTIAMCGKIIETILSSLYTKATGKDADAEGLGWDAIANRLKKERGYDFKGMREQLEVIKIHRNKAVHGSIVPPTMDEARGVLFFTRDVLVKIGSKKY